MLAARPGCTETLLRALLGQAKAVPAMWVLKGMKGVCSRYDSMATAVKPAGRGSLFRGLVRMSILRRSNPMDDAAFVGELGWEYGQVRRRVRRSCSDHLGAGCAGSRPGRGPGSVTVHNTSEEITASTLSSGRSMRSPTWSCNSRRTPLRRAPACNRRCMWGFGSMAAEHCVSGQVSEVGAHPGPDLDDPLGKLIEDALLVGA